MNNKRPKPSPVLPASVWSRLARPKGPSSDDLEKKLWREAPSQLPTYVTADSYRRILTHGSTENAGKGGLSLFACKKNGAPIKARMVIRAVFDRKTQSFERFSPVAELFCGSCDKPPVTPKNAPIFSDLIMTVSM